MQRFRFHPVVARWFEQRFGSPTEPQERGWPAIQSGGHTLIAAPTGSGKTLAAFLASLDALFRIGLDGKLRDETHVLYVSPLKALSNDIHKNLEEPLAGIRAALVAAEGRDIQVRAAVRTGDTPAAKRQAIAKKPPHILVTTPESFYLLLTSGSGRRVLSTVRTLIVDEIHAVVANRRGSHLALSMERLAALVKGPLQRIGLSATQKPIEEVARFLVGSAGVESGKVGKGESGKVGRWESEQVGEGEDGKTGKRENELVGKWESKTIGERAAFHELERRSPTRRDSSTHDRAGSETGAPTADRFIDAVRKENPGAALPLSHFPTFPPANPLVPCTIIDTGHARAMDLAIELPGSALEAVMSNEVWTEVYHRLTDLIQAHRTTLVFVNTRRMAERVAHQLCERLGEDKVTSHHGSLSAKLRLDAENRLKRGELTALVATASLELGIDIGSVDLVCQLGTTRSIATLLQRVGRAEHRRGGLPKGRLFPLTRDELVECAALLRCVRRGELDCLRMPEKPLDVLAQQITASSACEDWDEEKLFALMRSAYPYRHLTRQAYDEVVRMLAEGFSTKRGRRAALIHHDAVNHRLRGRRGSRLLALTSGGAIPDNADYRVVLEPGETFIGTVNEDFAVESMAGEIFQLGNASWKILGINSGTVRVEDAKGQPPGIPFWEGDAPARTAELSQAVAELREEVEGRLAGDDGEGGQVGKWENGKAGKREGESSSDSAAAAEPLERGFPNPQRAGSEMAFGRSQRDRTVGAAAALESRDPTEGALASVPACAEDRDLAGRDAGAPSGGQVTGALAANNSETVLPHSDSPALPLSHSPTFSPASSLQAWLMAEIGISDSGACQLAEYFTAGYKALGVLPSQKKLVMERFFDESGGMQLVIHSPFGARLNRAWGLALRKRFCRSFNFELQSAATDDAIVLSLGTQHSFPLDEVFRYLNSKSVREILVQALLDAPMFPIRWRWNATRSLALPRHRNGHKVPAPLMRMESENLLAAVFPDQLACLENIAGDREVPDHPLVQQTIEDCLTEAMDIEGLEALLRRIEGGEVQCIARDLPEPSPFASEILNARPYAFLDNAPLEERRTQAVYTRRAGDSAEGGLGTLDTAAIERVCEEAWPRATNADELHEALLLLGVMTEDEALRCLAGPERGGLCPRDPEAGETAGGQEGPRSVPNELLGSLAAQKRAGRFTNAPRPAPASWVAAERLPMVRAVYPGAEVEPAIVPPDSEMKRSWERADALRELVRGRMEVAGPITAMALVEFFQLPSTEIDAALLALEGEGFILRGKFHPDASDLEWCDRRLLARIHRLTINRLRAEIQPVSIAEFQRFLLAWQRVDAEHQVEGPEGVQAVLDLLDGYELPAAAWEPAVLALRVKDYAPQWLDQLCFTGRLGWGRLSPPQNQKARGFTPLRSSPTALFARENLPRWLELSGPSAAAELLPDTELVLKTLSECGALFFAEIVRKSGLLQSRTEQALGELAAQGWVTADSFEGMRALLVPAEKRAPFGDVDRKRRHKTVTSLEFAGRWSLLRSADASSARTQMPPNERADTGVRAPVPPNGEHAPRTDLAGVDLLNWSAARRPGAAVPDLDAPGRRPALQAREGEDTGAARDEAIEVFARVLLRRYGVVFRRLLERESLKVSWFELGRVYRRLEARGEIRGGHFVGGVSGEQFALPEAIGLLRSIRKAKPSGELIALSAADPLNLLGVLTPGPRITAIWPNRILLRDGVAIAALEAGKIIQLANAPETSEREIEHALRVGTLPASLRPYYG